MSQFDEYAKQVTKGLAVSAAEKERICAEVVAHLEDEAARLVATGLPRAEAETKAVEEFGKEDVMAGMVSAALAEKQKRHKRHRALFIALAALCAFLSGPLLALVPRGIFSVYEASNGGIQMVEPVWVYYPLLALLPATFLVLAKIASKLTHAPLWVGCVAGGVVVIAICCCHGACRCIGVLPWLVIPASMAPSLILIAPALLLRRDWQQYVLGSVSLALAIGTKEMLISGASYPSYPADSSLIANFLFVIQASGSVPFAFVTLEFFLLTWLLARGIDAWLNRRKAARDAQFANVDAEGPDHVTV